jgi:hypothetical protein
MNGIGPKSYRVDTKYLFPGRYAWRLVCLISGATVAIGHGRTRTEAQANGADAKARILGKVVKCG